MFSVKHAKHAKPAFHPTRSTLSAGLTAVLLPLCLATPALAQTATTSPASTTTSTAAPVAKQATALRLSGPVGTRRAGNHSLGARLLAGDRPVQGAYVNFQKYTSGGWVHLGRVLTNADGLATGVLYAKTTTRFRAVYSGSSTRQASTSGTVTVTVATLTTRQRATRVAAAQQGDPYRYGAVGPNAFDCSGLVKYSFAQVGKSLPRTSQDMRRATPRISNASKIVGDLIFIHSSSGRVTHVGVYAGNNNIWVAPRTGTVVKLQRIYTSSYTVGRVA